MNVIILCEFSGVVRDAFLERGHNAYSCDLSPSPNNHPRHYQGDALYAANSYPWDLAIAHPPCTYLANSGAKHLYIDGNKSNGKDEQRWIDMSDAASFFLKLYGLRHSIKKLCIENPRMHCHATQAIGIKHTQTIHPWEHGHGETKATNLYLSNLPLLIPTNIVDGREPVCHFQSPGIKNGLTRQQRRSITYTGIAKAMAEQWG